MGRIDPTMRTGKRGNDLSLSMTFTARPALMRTDSCCRINNTPLYILLRQYCFICINFCILVLIAQKTFLFSVKIRKKVVPDLLSGLRRAAARQHKM